MLNFSGSYWMLGSSAGRNVSSHTLLLPKPAGFPCQQFCCAVTAEQLPSLCVLMSLMLSYMNFPFGMSCSSLDSYHKWAVLSKKRVTFHVTVPDLWHPEGSGNYRQLKKITPLHTAAFNVQTCCFLFACCSN